MPRLHHLDLTVSDAAKSIEFYDKILIRLGFRRLPADEGVDALWLGRGIAIGLRAARAPCSPHARHCPGLHHLAFTAGSRSEVDGFYVFLCELGAQVLHAPAEYDYNPGYYAVFFLDPDGIKLELVHTPVWSPS